MHSDSHRSSSRRPALDPALRELLALLRDTFRDAAARIDQYLGAPEPAASAAAWTRNARPPREVGTRMPLEALREEARQISTEASQMDSSELRLRIEAVTAETRSLQNRATDPEDKDIAAKIMRALTAIVSEHRPGHVYGLARHHEADWDEIGRRARHELATGSSVGDEEHE